MIVLIQFARLAFVDLAALMRRVVAELNQRENPEWVTGRGTVGTDRSF